MKKTNFFKLTSPEKELVSLKEKSSTYWQKKGEDFAITFFQYASRSVPAYKVFLKKNKINSKKIKTYLDFLESIPAVTKTDYLKANNYLDLFPYKSLEQAQTFSATSGSSGEPFFLPRGEEQDWQYEYISRIILKENFQVHKKKTLIIIGFGLGIWIGGIFTYKSFEKIAQECSTVSIVPVGPNKETMLSVVKKFGHLYEQIILCGYPPFIKDLVDEAKKHNLDWGSYGIKLFTAAEGFSEEFREYLVKELHIKNPLTDITNIYGTVELGTMAYETPLSNLIKELVYQKKELIQPIFNNPHIPTVAQYYPHHIHFETKNNDIIVTGFGSAIPLIKYTFPDKGEVISFDTMIDRFKTFNIDLLSEAKKRKILHLVQKVPFVTVFGRTDAAVMFVGIVLYPEYIKPVFFDATIDKHVTGKFSLETRYDEDQNQTLLIHVELHENVQKNSSLEEQIQDLIFKTLLKTSTEYHYLYGGGDHVYKKKLLPKVILYEHGDKNYFNTQGKHKWTIK